MNKYIRTGLALLFLACQAATAQNLPLPEDQWELSRQSLVDILEESHYTPNEFADALGSPSFTALMMQIKPKAVPWVKAFMKAKVHSHLLDLDMGFAKESNGAGFLSKRCWEIQSYTFTYLTRTVDGREKVMSGRVTFPNYKKEGMSHQVKTISLHAHQALMDKEWAPSQSLMYMPLKALWDSAVIEPDLQKWGINYEIEADGGGSAVHMARQLADCTVAALEIMRRHGVTLSPKGYTTNWGSSQGALPTLQFAKWYDTEAPQWFKDALRLRSSYSVEGAIDSPDLMGFCYQHPEIITVALNVFVGYFKAFTPEQMGGYKAEEFVPQWFTDTKYQENGRDISFLDAISHQDVSGLKEKIQALPQSLNSFDRIVAPDMLTEDGKVDMDSPKIRAWLSCLKKYNSLEGWTPEHNVYIAHGPEDDMIPFEKSYNLYRTLSNQGKNSKVHMLSVPNPGFLPDTGMSPHYIISFMAQIFMAFEENPEDMRLRYKSVR